MPGTPELRRRPEPDVGRDQLEQQLRDSEARFRDFAETAADWFWETDAEHRYTNFFGLTELSGVEVNQFIGLRRWELPNIDLDDPAWVTHRAVMNDRRAFGGFEYCYHDADGNMHTARVNGKPVFDTAGRFLGYRGTAQDITRSKAAETALKASEEKYRQAVQLANLGHWIWDEIGNRCEYCSEELAAIYGVSTGEYLERSSSIERDLEWFHPDDQEHYLAVTQKAVEDKSGYEIVVRIIKDDGQVRFLHELTGPVLDENGRLIKTVGVLQDVTEKMYSEQALRKSEARLSTLFDNLPGGAYRVLNDETWSTVFRSSGYLDVVGASPSERREAERDKIYPALDVHPDDVDRMRREINLAIAEDRSFEFAYRIYNRKGEVRWMWERGRCVSEPGQKPEVLEGLILDVTQNRKTEQTLLQTQKLELVGQMSGGIAHDFNNLLGIIQGNAEMLAHEGLEDNHKLQTIFRAIAKGAELTQRLLAYARKQLLTPEVVDVNATLDDVLQLAGRVISTDIDMEVIKAPDAWMTWVDPVQLENAILNLLLNARDAMPEGGSVNVETSNVTLHNGQIDPTTDLSAGEYVRLQITDSGQGIPEDELGSVFEPFFTTKDVGEGSGLGLSMVRGFVEQSGGQVTIDSKRGRGTTVTIHLPRSSRKPSSQAVPEEQQFAKSDGAGVILLVEDEPDLRTMLVRQLEKLGYQILQASNAREATRLLDSAATIDFVLSDIVLPGGLSGYNVGEVAKARFPDVSTIYMSGYPEHRSADPSLSDRSADFLHKPFQFSELARVLERASRGSVEPSAT